MDIKHRNHALIVKTKWKTVANTKMTSYPFKEIAIYHNIESQSQYLKIAIHIKPKYRNSIESGDKHIVPPITSLTFTFHHCCRVIPLPYYITGLCVNPDFWRCGHDSLYHSSVFPYLHLTQYTPICFSNDFPPFCPPRTKMSKFSKIFTQKIAL